MGMAQYCIVWRHVPTIGPRGSHNGMLRPARYTLSIRVCVRTCAPLIKFGGGLAPSLGWPFISTRFTLGRVSSALLRALFFQQVPKFLRIENNPSAHFRNGKRIMEIRVFVVGSAAQCKLAHSSLGHEAGFRKKIYYKTALCSRRRTPSSRQPVPNRKIENVRAQFGCREAFRERHGGELGRGSQAGDESGIFGLGERWKGAGPEWSRSEGAWLVALAGPAPSLGAPFLSAAVGGVARALRLRPKPTPYPPPPTDMLEFYQHLNPNLLQDSSGNVPCSAGAGIIIHHIPVAISRRH